MNTIKLEKIVKSKTYNFFQTWVLGFAYIYGLWIEAQKNREFSLVENISTPQ